MKDKRLTTENLVIALRCAGIPRTLRVSQFLGIQAAHLLHKLELDLKLEISSNTEMPPGYLEEIDATVFFPWQILDKRKDVLYDSDGTYDYFAVYKGLTSERRSLCEYTPQGIE